MPRKSQSGTSGIALSDEWKRRKRRGGNRWWVRVEIPGTVPRQWVTKGFPDGCKTVAVEWGKETQTKLRTGELAGRKTMAMSEAAAALLESLKASSRQRAAEHLRDMSKVLTEASPIIGVLDRGALTRANTWMRSMRDKGLSPDTVKRHTSYVKSAVKYVVKAGLLSRDPLLGLKAESPQAEAPEVFTLPECALLVSDAALRCSNDPAELPNGRLFALLLWTGLRLREALWLRREDVDLDGGRIFIDAPTDDERADGARLKRNKVRAALLPQETADIMRTWEHEPDGYVFPQAMRRMNSTRALRSHLDAMGIPLKDRKVHSLRHSYCALALAAGVDGLMLRHAVGHATSEMTAHYSQAANRVYAACRAWRGIIQLRTIKTPSEQKEIVVTA